MSPRKAKFCEKCEYLMDETADGVGWEIFSQKDYITFVN